MNTPPVLEIKDGDVIAFPVTEEEIEEYRGLPKSVVLKRYMKAHRNEKCLHCAKFIGNHSEKAFSHCVTHETEKIAAHRQLKDLEASLAQALIPQEVPLMVCPACSEFVPPAPRCIRCGNDLRKSTIIHEV